MARNHAKPVTATRVWQVDQGCCETGLYKISWRCREDRKDHLTTGEGVLRACVSDLDILPEPSISRLTCHEKGVDGMGAVAVRWRSRSTQFMM